MWWVDEVVAAYVAAEGKLAVVHEVRRRLGREPEPAELATARRAVREYAAWPAPPDVTFGLSEPSAPLTRRGSTR